MSVLSNGCFNCLSITGRRATPLPAVPWAGSSSRPHPKGLGEGWRAGSLRARAILGGWWWQAGAERRVGTRPAGGIDILGWAAQGGARASLHPGLSSGILAGVSVGRANV